MIIEYADYLRDPLDFLDSLKGLSRKGQAEVNAVTDWAASLGSAYRNFSKMVYGSSTVTDVTTMNDIHAMFVDMMGSYPALDVEGDWARLTASDSRVRVKDTLPHTILTSPVDVSTSQHMVIPVCGRGYHGDIIVGAALVDEHLMVKQVAAFRYKDDDLHFAAALDNYFMRQAYGRAIIQYVYAENRYITVAHGTAAHYQNEPAEAVDIGNGIYLSEYTYGNTHYITQDGSHLVRFRLLHAESWKMPDAQETQFAYGYSELDAANAEIVHVQNQDVAMFPDPSDLTVGGRYLTAIQDAAVILMHSFIRRCVVAAIDNTRVQP